MFSHISLALSQPLCRRYALDEWGKAMADSDRRLALNFITRSSNQARRRMRNILSGVAKSEETDVATERGKIFKRFVVDFC